MALTRRSFLLSTPVAAAAVWGCARQATLQGPAAGARELSKAGSAGDGQKCVLVLMPDTPQTREVWKGLSDELDRDFSLVAYRIDGAAEVSALAAALDHYRPNALVLMNNPTVSAYRQLQRQQPQLKFPPAVVVMTSFLEGQTSALKSVTGITYEVPLITAMTNLRRLLVLPSERVGVVVRAPLQTFVEKQVSLAQREQVLVVREEVSASPNPSEVKRALRRLKERADVLWILNDDHLLTPRLIGEGWLPGLEERPWVPSIVGAASLVSPRNSFGTFAVLPDHVALGGQAGSMLADIAGSNFTVSNEDPVQLPLSTTTTIDLAQVKERFVLQQDALQQVDRILE